HKKSGARVLLLSNDDENKVFSIGFRTPPYDSTGLPHILEHSVLCGSKLFPAKDPFVELAKGSLNTFLNAMTYPDKTIYPVASCNDKDFQNLMHVYLDAVFYPNIYKREQIFRQEGWHYELEEKNDEITINGVVYNEMKGAFSSPDDMLDREVFNTLFPDTAYSYESGGDPEVIPTLTYEKFLDFHRKYYHPSNSYIYLYGNADMAEKLTFIDEAYLSKYEEAAISSKIELQKPFDEPVRKTKKYSITNEETEEDNTYLSYNAVIGTSLDRELYVAFQIIEYALLLAPGAVLKQTLLDRGIGKDIQSTYENGVLQPYFSVIAKYANTEQLDTFLDVIKEVLSNVVQNGIDQKALLAGINYFEFKYREADFGSYPKGLMYGLQAFDSWLYDDALPFIHIEANETFAKMREYVGSGYFEKLVETYLLHNTHASVVVVEPERGLTAKLDKKLADQMQAYKESLSEEETERLIADTKALIAYQEEPSTKEELLSIPLLKISDIKEEAQPYIYAEHRLDRTILLTHDIFTNGIGYLTLGFDTGKLPAGMLPYLGVLKNVLGFVSTKNYTYADLFNEININTGGITMGAVTYVESAHPDNYRTMFEVRAKVLFDKLPFAFEMIKEILFTSDFSDEKRLKEILAMLKSRLQTTMVSAGHSTAALRAMSYCSETASVSEQIGGVTFYRLIELLEAHFEEKKEEFIENLKKCMRLIFCEENLFVDYTADQKEYALLENEVGKFKPLLYRTDPAEDGGRPVPEKKNEGFRT
ncbi:MAG TPA: insulinase family protein, partial [Lachnospiraceae bacterium]|nr:insulinase family protein [Lachnospiraceae bacterium]